MRFGTKISYAHYQTGYHYLVVFQARDCLQGLKFQSGRYWVATLGRGSRRMNYKEEFIAWKQIDLYFNITKCCEFKSNVLEVKTYCVYFCSFLELMEQSVRTSCSFMQMIKAAGKPIVQHVRSTPNLGVLDHLLSRIDEYQKMRKLHIHTATILMNGER